jgi:hypothetical protein
MKTKPIMALLVASFNANFPTRYEVYTIFQSAEPEIVEPDVIDISPFYSRLLMPGLWNGINGSGKINWARGCYEMKTLVNDIIKGSRENEINNFIFFSDLPENLFISLNSNVGVEDFILKRSLSNDEKNVFRQLIFEKCMHE